MNDEIDIEYLVEEIAKVDPIAVTASKSSIHNCIISLTIHGVHRDTVSDEVLQKSEVSIGGTSAQLMVEFTHDGLNTMDDILVYSSDEINPDDFEVHIDTGFNTLYSEFEEYAGDRAVKELREILEDHCDCEDVDTRLLMEVSTHTEPAEWFFCPAGDTVIQLYNIHGRPYYLYDDGGVREAYKGTDYATEMLRDARYWNGTGEPISKSSVPA